MMKKLSYFTYESLPIYYMVTSLVLEGQVLQFYLVNPTFAKSELNSLMAFNKYSKAKFVLQLRFSAEIEDSQDTLAIKRWTNFGITYDQLSEFLYPNLTPEYGFAFAYKKKQFFGSVYDEYYKLILIEDVDKDVRLTYNLDLLQFNFLRKQIEKSLNIITGWQHPQQFIKKLEIQQNID